jgi:carboxymethylenebutenolidase
MIPHSSDWETLTVDGASMRTFVARPTDAAAAGSAPGILVIQHAGGVDQFVQGMARRLAAAGFVAAAPELYHRQDPPPDEPLQRMEQLRDAQVIADSDAVLDYLDAAADGPTARPVAVLGFCMGGRVAYLLAAASDRLRAAVAFYGGNTRVAWGEGPAPFERLGEIGCPVLGFFGGRDSNPSPEDRDAIDAELTRHGVEHRLHSFAGAGHGYMDFTNPARYHSDAAADSWPLTLEFLGQHLAAGS